MPPAIVIEVLLTAATLPRSSNSPTGPPPGNPPPLPGTPPCCELPGDCAAAAGGKEAPRATSAATPSGRLPPWRGGPAAPGRAAPGGPGGQGGPGGPGASPASSPGQSSSSASSSGQSPSGHLASSSPIEPGDSGDIGVLASSWHSRTLPASLAGGCAAVTAQAAQPGGWATDPPVAGTRGQPSGWGRAGR